MSPSPSPRRSTQSNPASRFLFESVFTATTISSPDPCGSAHGQSRPGCHVPRAPPHNTSDSADKRNTGQKVRLIRPATAHAHRQGSVEGERTVERFLVAGAVPVVDGRCIVGERLLILVIRAVVILVLLRLAIRAFCFSKMFP